QFEFAAQLSWTGGEDVFSGGKRDVATLYEYWAFLQLAESLAQFLSEPFDIARLIQPSADGLNLQLRKGVQSVLMGTAKRFDRILDVELWFNRTFGAGKPGGAW